MAQSDQIALSNHLISMVYKRDLRTSMRKAVLVLMADKASDDGSGIWAAKQTMADELCCSKQTVIATIKAFIDEGLVSECGTRKNATGYTVEYRLNVGAIDVLSLVGCYAEKPAKQSTPLTGQSPEPVNGTEARGQPPLPKPLGTPQGAKAPYMRIVDSWNEMAKKTGASAVRVVDNARKQTIRDRIKVHGEQILLEAIGIVGRSPFLTGDERSGSWRPTIDFLLQPKSLRSILEGAFGGMEGGGAPVDPEQIRRSRIATAELYDRMGRTAEAAELRKEAA